MGDNRAPVDVTELSLGIELTPEQPIDRIAELGGTAEASEYDAVFTSCHYNNRDPYAALHRIAADTETIAIGPGVANPYETHPVTLASKIATLDEASDGRAVFGIGPGDPTTLGNLGLAEKRGLRPVLEAFKTAQTLWAGDRVSHDGTFDATNAGLNYDPPSGSGIPILVGGEGPHMCRMAGKHADGLLFNGSHPDDLAWARSQVDRGIDDRPDERGPFSLYAYASVSVASDEQTALEAARPPVAFIAAGVAPPVLDRHGIDATLAATIGERIAEGAFGDAFELVTPEMIDAFAMTGDVESVADRMRAVLEDADGIVVGSPIGPTLNEAVPLAAEAFDRARHSHA
ncbi:MAG: 5,10-methylenetetrahydromethanopterin reductase [Halobacteriota archaeon]